MSRSFASRSFVSSVVVATCALFPLSAVCQTAFKSYPMYNTTDWIGVTGHGDFNGDGREDIVVSDFVASATTGSSKNGLLFLSSGDGTYDAPIRLPQSVATGLFAVGDFNHDGKLDFVAAGTGSEMNVYLGNGDGTFQAPRRTADSGASSEAVQGIIAADMNHDGNTDIVEALNNNNGGGEVLQVWLSNGDGTFKAGQRISSNVLYAMSMATGDFDGDGRPDVAIIYNDKGPTTIQVWYGDGAGNLESPYQITDPDGDDDRFDVVPSPVGDVNNDGKSDLVFYRTKYGVSNTGQFFPQIAVFEGSANRTLTFNTINTNNCPVGINVADFNGDGLNDLAYAEVSCDNFGRPYDFVVKPATSSGVFGAEQTIYTNPYNAGEDMVAIKTTQSTKPDLIFSEWTQQRTSPSTLPPQALVLLSNDSTGSFPGCGTPNLVEGLHMCAPPTTSANSPVRFSISSAGPTPMRTVAVWADGKKVAEQLTHAFSNYSFLDQAISLSPGAHNITIYGTGWDNTLQKKSFTLNVGGGAGSCTAPNSPGVNVCSPGYGATVDSPTQVMAAANITGTLARMEVWVDGVKRYTETTSTSLNTSISLSYGYHRFDIYAVNTSGTKYEKTVYATVNSGSCPADSGYDVHVCSPISGSTNSSPVRAVATAHITGTLGRMEVWVDGVKKYTETSNLTLSTSIPLNPGGNHRFDFYAVNTQGTKWETTIYATVP